jgi:hypothetical protein
MFLLMAASSGRLGQTFVKGVPDRGSLNYHSRSLC